METNMQHTANVYTEGFQMGLRNGLFFSSTPLIITILLLLVFYRRKAVKQTKQ